MNKNIPLLPVRLAAKFVVSSFAILVAGFVIGKESPVSQRGWIGGEYKLARKGSFATALSPSPAVVGCLPKAVATTQKAAILITSLNTNAPAQTAGLRKGDLILELNHQPVTRLRSFRRVVDRCEPGTLLAVKAYREGQTLDFEVPVGKETFRRGGNFCIMFPSVVHGWQLCLNPGLSFVFAGWEPNPGLRGQLGNSKEIYDEKWKVFAGIFEASSGERIIGQQN